MGSLWLRLDALILKNCQMKLEPFREYVAKLSPRQWVIMTPKPFTETLSCGSRTIKSVRIENQTLLTLPEDCHLDLKIHKLSTDINLMYDFKVEILPWRFSGDVFRDAVSNKKDLNELVREIVASRSKFSVKDLSHLKYHYTPPPNQLARLWNTITSLSIFSGFSNIFSFFIYAACAWVIYIVISKGWLTRCIRMARRKPKPQGPILRPLRSSVRYPPRPPLVRKDPEMSPPPYSSVTQAPYQSPPSAPSEDPELQAMVAWSAPDDSYSIQMDKCVSKSGEGDMQNFVCSIHAPLSSKGCSGYFAQ